MRGMLPAQVVEIVDNEMTRIASQKTGALLGTIIAERIAGLNESLAGNAPAFTTLDSR